MFKSIIVKVGTNVLTDKDGQLNLEVMENLVKQIVAVRKQGTSVILVSSGAMGAGRSVLTIKEESSAVAKRQVLCAVGQIKLMGLYSNLFSKQNTQCAQVLATKEDFRDKTHYINMRTCFDALLKEGVLPIVNENDVVSVSELMFTDNDELAGLLGSMMNVDAVIILSSVEGLLDASGKAIPEIDFAKTNVEEFISSEKSQFGRGGMSTKCRIVKRLASTGITSFIANGRRPEILLDILKGEKVGTLFKPLRKASGLKKRIAYWNGYEKGALVIDEKAEKILKESIASLLPVGVTAVEGEFQKGDLIKIKNRVGESLGVGLAKVNSESARQMMGQKNQPALIHYDHLFLES